MSPLRSITLLLACFPMIAQAPLATCTRADIQVVQNLSFGGLVVNSGGGSVTLTADGALIPDGAGVLPGAKPPAYEARFRLTGPPNAAFTLKVDPQFPMLNSPTGGAVRISEFFGSLPNWTGRFNATGEAEFRLGGRLDITANPAPALYATSQSTLQLNIVGVPGVGTVNKSFTISVLLRAPVNLSNLGPLNFGVLMSGSQPGEFEVLPDGSYRSLQSNGPTLLRGVPQPASFSLRSSAGTSYTIWFPQQITLTGPGSGVKVYGFTCDIPVNGTLPADQILFRVGGRVVINPNQAFGQYRGTLPVVVYYQ